MIIENLQCKKCSHIFDYKNEFVVDFNNDFEKQYSHINGFWHKLKTHYTNDSFQPSNYSYDHIYCPKCDNKINFSINIEIKQDGEI